MGPDCGTAIVAGVPLALANVVWRGDIGIVAASFSSADSALTSLTTSYCVDIRRTDGDERLRKRTHLVFCLLFAIFILVFHHVNSRSLRTCTQCSFPSTRKPVSSP